MPVSTMSPSGRPSTPLGPLLLLVVTVGRVGALPVTIPGLPADCYWQRGHLTLGLLLRLHDTGVRPALCSQRLYKVARLSYLEAFVFAVRQLNARADLLPNVTLGFLVLDTCAHRVVAVSRALYFVPGRTKGTRSRTDITQGFEGQGYGTQDSEGLFNKTQHHTSQFNGTQDQAAETQYPSGREKGIQDPTERFNGTQDSGENCELGPPDVDVAGVVGPPSSGDAVLVASLLSGFQVPLISPSATSDDLSDKARFEYFLRVVPPDSHQVAAMLDLLLHYGWTYVSLLYSQGEYGLNAADLFEKTARVHGVCLAVSKMLRTELTDDDADRVYDLLVAQHRARVVVLYLISIHQRALFGAAERHLAAAGGSGTHFVWVGSDIMAGKDYGPALSGALVMYHAFPRVPRFEQYYSQLTPENNAANPWMRAYWAKIHSCTWGTNTDNPCENYTAFTGWQDHVGAYVAAYMDAVYVYAHALDCLIRLRCPWAFRDPSVLTTCLQRPLLLQLLRNHSFEGVSGRVQFDEVGDAVGKFSVRQFIHDRMPRYMEVGVWRPLADSGQQLTMYEHLTTWAGQAGPPESVCSKPCGVHQYVVPTDTACCWTCRACRDNEVVTANLTGCTACPALTWPDTPNQTVCFPVLPVYVHPAMPIGLLLTTLALLGLGATLAITVWYYTHSKERLIRASSRELSGVVLLGLGLEQVTALLLVVQPSDPLCAALRVGFHVSVTLVYAPVCVRALRIYRIFTAGKKGVKQPAFVGSRSQLVLTTLFGTPQIILVLVTCLIVPPTAVLHMPVANMKLVELFCDFSVGGVVPALTFNLVLLAVCTVLAFLTRGLPDNFRESWYMFVSVATTLFLWVVAVPALLSASHADHRALLAGSCLITNSLVGLACLFLPKVYAIHFVSEESLKIVDVSRIADVKGHSEQRAK